MTCVTGDRWIASVDRGQDGRLCFRLQLPPDRTLSQGAPATIAEEAACTLAFSGFLYGRGAGVGAAAAILRAYLSDGERALTELRGCFGGVLWDSRREMAIAFRDPLGIHPLFVAADDAGRWLFAPAVDLLVEDRRIATPLDPIVLAERLVDQWASRDEIEYQRIRRVLPGHTLVLSRAGETTARYWNPPAADLRVRHRADAVDRFEHAFRAAVGRALDLGRAGIFLSGGIDSISVAAAAVQHASAGRGERPVALSLLYADPDFQEADVQRAVADALELSARQIPLAQAIGATGALAAAGTVSAIGSLIALNAEWPVPAMNIWTPAFLHLARAGREAGCDVILTGGGGDEWLGVTPFFAADLLGSLRVVDWVRFCRNTVRSYDIGVRGALSTLGWTFGLKPVLARLRDRASVRLGDALAFRWRRRALPDWIAPDAALRAALEHRGEMAARRDRSLRASAPTFYDFETRRSLDHPLVVGELETRFHFGRCANVWMVEPYWDAELIELLYTMAPDDLSLGGFSKGLVHRLVHTALPNLPLIKQRKIAVTMAYQDRVRREGRQAWQGMGGVRALADLGIVDARKLADTIDRILARDDDPRVWLLPYVLSVEAWVRAHG